MSVRPVARVLQQLRRLGPSDLAGEAPDAELVERFTRHGEEAAFAGLLRRHGPMVLRVCRGVLGDGPDAEDAFQQTFVLLARKAGTLARPEAVAAWLHGTARRLVVRCS